MYIHSGYDKIAVEVISLFLIGQSVDIHQLVEGRKLIIGGVEIPYHKGLLGHSDADVLLHAIIESIIGALGLGDIGKHFSDKDDAFKGISSLVLLEKTYEMMKNEGYQIQNIDSIIMVEQPHMAPHIAQMKKNVSSILCCDINRVNIKATRGEKLGWIGEGLGIQAQCVTLLKKEG